MRHQADIRMHLFEKQFAPTELHHVIDHRESTLRFIPDQSLDVESDRGTKQTSQQAIPEDLNRPSNDGS